MNTDGEKWHYTAVTGLSGLLRGITSKKKKYNQGEKSIRSPFIIYADLECLLEKISTCYNNPEESSTTEINKHAPSGYSLFTHCSFDKTKNKLD